MVSDRGKLTDLPTPDVMVVFGRPRGDRGSYQQWKEKGIGRCGEQLIAIANREGWVSRLLGVRFTQANGDLEIYRPDDRRFLSSVELDRVTEVERKRVDLEEIRANQEQQRADQAVQEVTLERDRSNRMAEYLRSIGVDPTQI